MEKIIAFGERVPGYDIPVLNEREVRAAAGILFLIIFISLMIIIFKNDFSLAKYSITFFLSCAHAMNSSAPITFVCV